MVAIIEKLGIVNKSRINLECFMLKVIYVFQITFYSDLYFRF